MLPAEVLSPMKPVRILLIVIVVLYAATKLIVPVPAVNEVILSEPDVEVEKVRPEPPEIE
jgi:hypothetical protein